MTNYEIMLIIDPKAEIDETNKLIKEVFAKDLVSFEQMKRNELAYPINKQMRAIYALIKVKTDGAIKIKEFQRRAAISKDIWRELVINVDSEVGLGKKPKSFKGKPPRDNNRNPRENRPYRKFRNNNDSDSENNTRTERPRREKPNYE